MKKNTALKFSMTVIAALVLAACGSSGSSGSSKYTASTNTNTNATKPSIGGTGNTGTTAGTGSTGSGSGTSAGTGTTTPTTAPAPTTAPTTTPAPTTAPTTAPVPTTPPVSTAPEANHQQLQQSPSTSGKFSFVGHKNVVKNESNLLTNSSSTTDTKADTPEGMQVQNPFPSLDTIVVGEERDKDGKPKADGVVVYLEDFDFRGNAGILTGEFSLENLYIHTDPTKGAKTTLGSGTGRTGDTAAALGITRENVISEMGTKKGTALVYQEPRVNYTPNYTNKLVDNTGKTVLASADPVKATGPAAAENASRSGKETVAEVYGARTNAVGGAAEYGKTKDFQQLTTANAPFQKLDGATELYTKGSNLKNVQYGRVTSALHLQDLKDLKEGLQLGNTKTLVGAYGQKGNKGTEDNYFYRGTENISAAQLEALKTAQPNGELTYNGHAVTYGINNNWYSENDIQVPTAIGGSIGMVSGTHVTATVNLGNNDVTGNLYNNWYSSANNGVVPVKLVKFNGKLADNGNIAGDATKLDNGSKGLFGATLFGKDAAEMGGVISSNDKEAGKAWGAVFGATKTETTETPAAQPTGVIGSSNNNGTNP